MVDWQITATTITCEAVDDEVTILVHGDWTVKCTGFERYNNRRGGLELVKKSMVIKKLLECKGLECPRILEYKEKLMSEEQKKDKQS